MKGCLLPEICPPYFLFLWFHHCRGPNSPDVLQLWHGGGSSVLSRQGLCVCQVSVLQEWDAIFFFCWFCTVWTLHFTSLLFNCCSGMHSLLWRACPLFWSHSRLTCCFLFSSPTCPDMQAMTRPPWQFSLWMVTQLVEQQLRLVRR